MVSRRVEKHSGHIVRSRGDGYLIAFAQPAGAVSCSVAVQRELAKRPNPFKPCSCEARSISRSRLGESLMQLRPNVVGGVGISLALVARHQHSTRHDACDTGQPNQLPYASHGPSLPKLPW